MATDWREDLAKLLGDVADSPVGQGASAVLGSGLAQGTFNVLGAPASALRGGIGELEALANQHQLIPFSEAQGNVDRRIAGIQEQDFGPFGALKTPVEIGANLVLDPLNWTGVGAAGKIATGLEAAGKGGLLSRGLHAAQLANDVPGKVALERGIQPAFRAVGAGLERARPGILDLSPRSQLRVEIDQVHNALLTRRSSGVPQPMAGGAFAHPGGTAAAYPHHPALSQEENDVLNQVLEDGTTYGTFLDSTAHQAVLDKSQLQQAGVSWKVNTKLNDRLEIVKGKPHEDELKKIVKRWHERGIDLLHADSPDDIATVWLERTLAKERGIKPERSTTGGLLRAAFGEQALFSGRYHTGNIQGAWIMNALRGVMPNNPMEFEAAYRVARGGLEETSREAALSSLRSTQTARRWGLDQPDVEVLRGGLDKLVSNYDRTSRSAMGELASRITRNERIGEVVGRPFVANNNFGLAVDYATRGAIWSDTLDREMMQRLPAWEAAVKQRAANIPGFQFSVLDDINAPASLKFNDLKRHLTDLGMQPGQAERAAGEYNHMLHQARGAAKRATEEAQFSYARTNLDEWIGKFVPFHYWYSRALRFYGEEAIRNPYLALNYMRANQGIEDAQNDPGLSARQKGFLRLMGTPLGFSLLMNPDALFGVVKVFGMDRQPDDLADPNAKWFDPPRDMTAMGGALDWLKNRGLGLYPWLDGTLNLLGMYGNTFEPDLLGIRHRALVGSAVNWAMAHAGAQPPGTPYATAMGQARWALSSAASTFLPGSLAQPVAPKPGNSTQEASLDTIIENIIIANNPGLTGDQLLEMMADPDSPEYKQAYRVAADAGITTQLLNFVIPEQFTMRHDARDVLAAQAKEIGAEASRTGQNPYQFKPLPGDLDFAARYKRLTGSDWKPGDYDNAKMRYDLSRAPSEDAKRMVVDQAAYATLGSESDRKVFETHSKLLYGESQQTAGLPETARRTIADTYLDKSPGARAAMERIYLLRDAFKQTHPQYAAYLDWRDKVRQLANQYGGDLSEYRRQSSVQNPNAARYFADRADYIKRTAPQSDWQQRIEDDTVSVSAYMAITGQPELRSTNTVFPGGPTTDITLPAMLPAAPPETPYNPEVDWMGQLAREARYQGVAGPYG